MNNPYSVSESQDVAVGSWKDVFQRAVVLVLYLGVWAVAVYVTGPLLNRLLGGFEIGMRPADSQLTLLQSFNRFAYMYWFTAFLLISFPLDVIVWLVLRRRAVRPTRWSWLAICSALIPVALVAAWLLFRPLLFAPESH